MSNSPFDFSQLSTKEEPLSRRRKGSRWMPIALGGAGLVVCAGAVWLLRSLAGDSGPQPQASKVAKTEPSSTQSAAATAPPPALDAIEDLTVDDDRPVIGQVHIKSDETPGEIRFSLVPPSPRGARIDPSSGEFHWKPAGVKPGDYQVTVQARRTGAKEAAKASFTIHVVSTDPPLERLLSELSDQKQAELLPEGFPSPYEEWLPAPLRVIRVGDEQVHAFVFDTVDAADAAAKQIAPDLSTVGERKTAFKTAASCFRRGRLIAFYAGNISAMRETLTERLGTPLAERQAPEREHLAASDTMPVSTEPSASATTEPVTPPTTTPSKDEVDALVELYQGKKLFVKKEYPTLRKLFAERFERDHAAPIAAAVTGNEKRPDWLDGPAEFKEELFTAIDPAHDNVEAALKLVTQLQDTFPDKFTSYGELAIALAVTWDKPESIYDYTWHARRCQSKLPPGMLDAINNFKYLLDAESAMQGRVQFMPWEFLVLVVNHKTPTVEREWAVHNYLLRRMMYGKCYSDVPYDDIMLESNDKTCRLANKDYTLANLRQYGGVCAMQADFAARVGQSLGVPAAYVGGESNSGGLHAWVIWVELKSVNKNGISFSIESHGRYRDDQYFVGHLTDPRTGEPSTDRELEVRLHAVGVNPQNQRHARLAMQAFPILRDKLGMDVGEQIRYLANATGLCAWNEDAWYALADLSQSGKAGKAQSKALAGAVDRLFTTFAGFPDFTWKVFDSLIAFQQDDKQRIKLYERLVALYELALRPDLACEARLKLSDYQAEAGNQGDAIEGLAFTIKKFPGEGRYVPRMLDKLEALAKDLKGADAKLVQFYQEFLPLVPQKRGDVPTEYCLKIYQRAIDRFKEAGQAALAQTWTAQLTLLKAQKTY